MNWQPTSQPFADALQARRAWTKSKTCCGNRIAFGWKFASKGEPVVLIYIGWIGDRAISSDDWLQSDAHWRGSVSEHIRPVFPEIWIDRDLPTERDPFWFLVRSLPCARQSPPPE